MGVQPVDRRRPRAGRLEQADGHQHDAADPADRPGVALEETEHVDQALERMSARYPRPAQVVELRFFGGLDSPEIAQTLDISLSTVERDWRFAKAWLQNEIASA